MHSFIFHFLTTLLALLSLIACDAGKVYKDTLVRVGELTIYVSEFQEHYQYNPYLKKFPAAAAAKKEVLAALIAQKLLAQANTSPETIVQEYIDQFQREAVIEKFWEDSIAAQINVSDQEISELYLKSKTKKIIRYYAFGDSGSARRAHQIIAVNHSFQYYAQLTGVAEQHIPTDTIVAGKSLQILEDIAYSLQIGETSGPVKIARKYFIINLFAEQKNIFQSDSDLEKQIPGIKKILKRRKMQTGFQEFIRTHYSRPPYQLNHNIFKNMVQAIEMQYDFSNYSAPTISDNELENINPDLDDIKDDPVIAFGQGETWSVEQLMKRLRVSPYPISFQSPGSYRKSMIVATKNLLDDEILANEAFDMDLDDTDYVLQQTAMWKDHILALDYLQTGKYNSAVLDSLLADLLDSREILVNHDLLLAIPDRRTNMLVFKTHFPVRTIVPPLVMTDTLPVYRKKLQSRLSN